MKRRKLSIGERARALCALWLLVGAAARPAEVPYTTASWPVEGFGNHRVRISVAEKADLVLARIPWRRRDARPEAKDTIVVDAATGKRVDNVLRLRVDREVGELLFQPPTAPGEYFAYTMPFKTEGWAAFPTTVYLPARETADPAWVQACEPIRDRLREGNGPSVPEACIVEFQAINDFHRFDPMEVIATEEETREILERHRDEPYLIFPEDRTNPIRMTEEIPRLWAERGPGTEFRGQASRGESYWFQLGLWAAVRKIEDLAIAFGDLSSKDGGRIPASAFRCIHAGGTDWIGRPFRKTVSVERGKIQPLWIGVAVPQDASPGDYEGRLAVRAKDAPEKAVRLTIQVEKGLIEDGGDEDLWRQSRLRWLDSTLGIDDEVFAPYLPIEARGWKLGVLGREMELGATGLPAAIRSFFRKSVGGADADGEEILAGPMEFSVLRKGAKASWEGGARKVTRVAPGAVSWEAAARSGSLEYSCRASLECDGYANFRLELRSREACDLDDVRLEIPVRRQVARYFMGMGRKGGLRPAEWRWNWDPSRANGHLWIGDVHAGLHLKLKHLEDRWDLYTMEATGVYRDWGNGGKGGCDIVEGEDRVLVRAMTGPRRVAAGETLRFHFGLLITPVKVLDPGHWNWRYFHHGSAAPLEEIVKTGATVINLHHGDALNPHINYPFVTAKELAAYTARAHEKDLKVKIYYTVRELSNHAAEFWALRSLGNEVYLDGPGFRLADQFLERKPSDPAPKTGDSWLCEHAVTSYVPAWHQPLGNGRCDAAVATVGLSRWHNSYIEGLAWLLRHVGIDGLYLDGIGYDREIMKRVRKVLQANRPGSLIDFHSGNNFHPDYGLNNCASQYLEHFPFIDSLWFGEGFDYNESPDYWLVEISGIPFGLFGEMLEGGGNPWRGMVYGMSNRLGWGGDPREIWKVWDDFGIEKSEMLGYWDPRCPVRTGRDDVLATAYVKPGEALVSLASWSADPVEIRLEIRFEALGMSAERAHLYAPLVPGFQEEALFAPGDPVPVAPGRGWLFFVSEKPRRGRG